jgi:hypothetical protein
LNAASIRAASAALFGPNWSKRELATALGWDLRGVQRWCSGQQPIHPLAQGRLMGLLRERHIGLTSILAELEAA